MAKKADSDGQILRGMLDTLVLAHLRKGPNYGYGILEGLGRQLGRDAGLLKESTLYPLLHRLERKGYLASHHEPGDRGSPRKYYRLTPAGTDFLEGRIREWRRIAALLRRTVLEPSADEGPSG